MRLHFFLAAAAASLVLSACAQRQEPVHVGGAAPPPPSVAGECSASSAQFALGKLADKALVDEARERSGAREVRVIKPGQAITMDFSTQRLNLEVDAGNLVTLARCG